jgi:hypothetical protein
MSEPTITCPKCKHEIKLNESLAAPFMEKAQRDFEARIALAREDEAKKARLAASTDLNEKEKELSELKDTLKSRESKLAQAQKDQAEALKLKQQLEDAIREHDLNVQKQINERLATVREEARKEAENEQKLKVSEKDLLISQMQQKIEELRRRSEQGSQQSQGEVLELELESLLRNKFPTDIIEPVAKGVSGADVTHKVIGNTGEHCGIILWEFKRTKNWSVGWLEKLRDDKHKAKANVAIIASQSLPDTIKSFGIIEGVWVVHLNYIIPLAALLRQSLVDLSTVRQSKVGQQTKTEMMYSYLTSNEFRLRVEAVVESISNIKEDLDTEKKAIMKQWAKREKEINKAIDAIVGMYGDMQGIAGKSLPEIKGLGFEGLEDNKE